ncbi:MAG: NUDIX domain-containing protein [Verrucomicrobia bacterium]|nr:NUDIX domain-containing protein [Verrucomicrobiota bacterium]
MDKPMFLFCSRCGGSKLTARTYRLFECESCRFEHYINPLVAVAAIIADSAGQILLIRRARNPGQGKVSLPGGMVDPGETAEQALRREVMEEVNLQVDRLDYLASFPNQYPYQGVVYPALDLFYTGSVETFAPARAMEEVQSLMMAAPAALDFSNIAFSSVEQALRLYAARVYGR